MWWHIFSTLDIWQSLTYLSTTKNIYDPIRNHWSCPEIHFLVLVCRLPFKQFQEEFQYKHFGRKEERKLLLSPPSSVSWIKKLSKIFLWLIFPCPDKSKLEILLVLKIMVPHIKWGRENWFGTVTAGHSFVTTALRYLGKWLEPHWLLCDWKDQHLFSSPSLAKLRLLLPQFNFTEGY